jgi:hypothetical protein
MHVSSSSYDDTGASDFETLGCHSCDSCMYPPPQMTCMYPPPHMTIPALLISKPVDAIPVIHVCICMYIFMHIYMLIYIYMYIYV